MAQLLHSIGNSRILHRVCGDLLPSPPTNRCGNVASKFARNALSDALGVSTIQNTAPCGRRRVAAEAFEKVLPLPEMLSICRYRCGRWRCETCLPPKV